MEPHRTTLRRVFANNVMNVLIILLVSYNIYLTRQFHAQAVHGREMILAMESRNEKMLLSHMKRTVERWEALQKNNPQLNVKQVPEPVQ